MQLADQLAQIPRTTHALPSATTKEKAGYWTRRRAFAQVRRGQNIQLLPFSLVTQQRGTALLGVAAGSNWVGDQEAYENRIPLNPQQGLNNRADQLTISDSL
jgi:hypothetical protein